MVLIQNSHKALRNGGVLLAFSLLLLPSAFSQKPAQLKKTGEAYFGAGNYQEAILPLSQYQQEKPGDLGVLTKLGICYFHLHNAEKARQYLDYVLSEDATSPDPEVLYYIARVAHAGSEFAKAATFYKIYLKAAPESHVLRGNAIDNIKRCMAGQYTPAENSVALVENLGDKINTPYDEFAPLPSANVAGKLYFASARVGCTGGLRDADGYSNAVTGDYCSDIYFSVQAMNGWQDATPLDPLLNTARHEVAMGFTRRGRILHFFRGFTLYSGQFLTDTAGNDDQYRIRENLFQSAMSPEDGDTAPFFYNDTIVLFASRRAGGFGGLDLYYSTYTRGAWTWPVNLGPNINTPYDETWPFLAPNGYDLFFSNNGLKSIGGLDFFKATFDRKRLEWSPALHLGTPLNSPGDEECLRLMPDGMSVVFASDRLESLGRRDLFIAYFKEEVAAADPAGGHFLLAAAPSINTEEGQEEQEDVLSVAALSYNTDKDVLSAANLKILDKIAALARLNPKARVRILAHTDETGPSKFDLYYGIKRAEAVAKALESREVPTEVIAAASMGPNYPLARNVLGTEPNPVGRQLNRRIEVELVSAEGGQPVFIVQQPAVSELMASDAAIRMQELQLGLSYKIQVATTRQILTNDALSMFSDVHIEALGGSYVYTAGWVKKYEGAVALRQELRAQGFEDALIIPYINGIRVGRSEADRLKRKFPDLEEYLRK